MMSHRFFHLTIFFIGIGLVFGTGAPERITAQGSTPPAIVRATRAQCVGTARTLIDAPTGRLRFLGSDAMRPAPRVVNLPAATSPEAAARLYLAACGEFFGVRDQARELRVLRAKTTERGRNVIRFQQTYRDIPVLAGEMIAYLDSAKNLIAITSEILPDIAIATAPTVPAEIARERALETIAKNYQMSRDALGAASPELWIFNPQLLRPGLGSTRLVWRIVVTPNEVLPIRELVLVDAQRGNIALHFNQIDFAKNRQTYSANNTSTLPGTLVCNEADPTCAGGDTHAVGAHLAAGETYDFYLTNHGRDSINNAGMLLKSTVHYGASYANAFWSGSQMVYGDAYGFPLADDVVAHELTHGVTESESNLFYYYQSGAINESFSDVWGEFVDLTNGRGNDAAGVRWLLGEDVSGMGALRNMQNPPAFSDPDKMTSAFYVTSNADNGGVHTNSGINNKAAVLMVDGGSFNGRTVASLGLTQVAKIYYEAQTNLLTSGADYADLYNALYQACINLVGVAGITSADCDQVRNATDAVEMNLQPVTGFNPDAPLCSAGNPATLFYDSFESGASNWVVGALNGTNRWQSDSPYGRFAHSGLHFLYADDYPATISDSYAAMNFNVTLPQNGYLHFAHAYDFELGKYDSGVLEYSVNNGGAWNDAGGLFDAQGYNGIIASGSGNPLGGRSGFVNTSHGYISSRMNLNSLVGQNIRFRWRMGLDAGGYMWGWWLDDVRIYQCVVSVPVPATNFFPFVGRDVISP